MQMAALRQADGSEYAAASKFAHLARRVVEDRGCASCPDELRNFEADVHPDGGIG